MVNGKQKGSAYERQICVKLSRWVSAGKNDDLFWRSAMSGGRATVSAKSGKKLNNQAGDICAVGPKGFILTATHYLECKFYKDLDLESFFLKGQGKLAAFWVEATKQAALHSKTPLLIAKQNRCSSLLVAPPNALQRLLSSPIAPLCRVSNKSILADVWFLDDVLASPFKGIVGV